LLFKKNLGLGISDPEFEFFLGFGTREKKERNTKEYKFFHGKGQRKSLGDISKALILAKWH
jgi:hypothetical protein